VLWLLGSEPKIAPKVFGTLEIFGAGSRPFGAIAEINWHD
jgi:hypothetical protein